MQRAHGGDKSQPPATAPGLAASGPHILNGGADFQYLLSFRTGAAREEPAGGSGNGRITSPSSEHPSSPPRPMPPPSRSSSIPKRNSAAGLSQCHVCSERRQ